MAIKLTEIQLQLLVNALNNRVNEIETLINPLLLELATHRTLLEKYNFDKSTYPGDQGNTQGFEQLPWSKKIIRVLVQTGRFMTTNEIVAEIIIRIPGLAEEASTRSSVASILSRRSGKLFTKLGDKYGLIEWKDLSVK